MSALAAVAGLGLPDCWIGAGFVRNRVWDALHSYAAPTPPGDLDVVYHDPLDAGRGRDRALERRLSAVLPARWSVKNQARMHRRNGHPPYGSTAAAVACWPETATAVAARRTAAGIELLAPFGVADLLALRVRPTPCGADRPDIFRARIAAKRWQELWPRLAVSWPP